MNTNHNKSHIGKLILFALFITNGWANAQHKTEFEFYDGASENLRKTMQNNTNAIFGVIHDAYYSKKEGFQISPDNATSEAIERLLALWSTSNFYCTKIDIFQSVLKIPNGNWQVRNIPIFLEQGETDEDKYQDIVIEFTPGGKINDVYIAIPLHQVEKILGMGATVTDVRRRQLIIGFVEDFRTAYNRKDINYLNQVFSSDALIITGKVLKSNGEGLVTKTAQGKEQYIKNLRMAFANNRYINVKFSDIEVMQPYGKEKDYIYCVRLVQDWNSTNYSDKGWLFLIIDFRNEDEPQIWVRAWDPYDMPEKYRTGEDDFTM